MASVSFTAFGLSPNDENNEVDKLSKDEKEAIINDMYGRKNNFKSGTQQQGRGGTAVAVVDRRDSDDIIPIIMDINEGMDIDSANDNDNDTDDEGTDITEELLDQFENAVDSIPISEKTDYLNALLLMPDDLFDSESNAKDFLRAENYDATKAARRMVKYWEMRCDIFNADSFEPITLRGAMKNVVPYMVQIPNICRILPNDDSGRTVICWDRTGMSYKDYDTNVLLKIAWYVFHVALQQMRQQRRRIPNCNLKNEIVFIGINTSSSWDFPQRNFTKLAHTSVSSCIPVQICCTHACQSSLVSTCLLPVIKLFYSRDARLRMQAYNTMSQQSMLNALKSFGLHKENLPTSIGGIYNEQPIWIRQCEKINERKKQKRQRTSTET